MSTDTVNVGRSDFELGNVITNETLYLLEHQKNFQRLRSIVDYEVLIKTMTWYVEEFCEKVKRIRFVSFPYPNQVTTPDTLPVKQDYVEKYYGNNSKGKILTYMKELRTKLSTSRYKELEHRLQGTQNEEEREKLEAQIKDIRVHQLNRYTELFNKLEVVTFFSPGRPSLEISGGR